jgi:hypothetical protein
METKDEKNPVEKPIPENFEKIITDMTNDLTTTFPEYSYLWNKWTSVELNLMNGDEKTQEIQYLYNYCKINYPERFFDILYNNESIFDENEDKKTLFLPGVDFKILFHCKGVSENTRKIMWNYLQLIMMTIVSDIDSKEGFGESTKQLFEGIDETELYEKLNETMTSMSGFFQSMTSSTQEDEQMEENNTTSYQQEDECKEKTEDEEDEEDEEEDTNTKNPFFEKMKGLPNIKDIYGHLKTLFDGKIGSLAKELAEEISGDVNNIFGEVDASGNPVSPKNTKDIIQNLLKNPEKMTGLIKTVSDKLNTKITSGEISKDELMKEATDILGKMKGMGDNKQFQEMFKNISKMSGLGGNAKFNMNAFQQMSKQSSTRERLKERMLKKQQQQQQQQQQFTEEMPAKKEDNTVKIEPTNKPNNYKFTIVGEENAVSQQEVTPSIINEDSLHKKKKKKHNKNK